MQRPPLSPSVPVRRGIPQGDSGRVSKSEGGNPLAALNDPLKRDSLAATNDDQAGTSFFPSIKRAPSSSPQKGSHGGFPLKMRERSPSPALDSLDENKKNAFDTLHLGRSSPEQEKFTISRLVRQSPSPLRASESNASGHYLTKGPRSYPESLPHASLPPVVPYSPFLGSNPLLTKTPIVSRMALGSTAASEVARGNTEPAWGRTKSWNGLGRVAEGEPPAPVQEVLPCP